MNITLLLLILLLVSVSISCSVKEYMTCSPLQNAQCPDRSQEYSCKQRTDSGEYKYSYRCGEDSIDTSNFYAPCNSGCTLDKIDSDTGCCPDITCDKCCVDGITCDDGNCLQKFCPYSDRDRITGCCPDVDCDKCCQDGLTCRVVGEPCVGDNLTAETVPAEPVTDNGLDNFNILKDSRGDLFYTDCLEYQNSLVNPTTVSYFENKCKESVASKLNLSDTFTGKLIGFDSSSCALPNKTKGICSLEYQSLE